MTVRRDLKQLENEGLLKRSHGGATVATRISLEFALEEEGKRHQREKLAIGEAAAGLVKAGDRILVGTGTTTRAMACAMRGHRNVLAVTTSLSIVSVLLSSPGVDCMLMGGMVHKRSPDLYGPLLEENLSQLHADCAFVGAAGVSAKGILSASDPQIARVTRLMMNCSERVVLLMDSSKAHHSSFVAFGGLEHVDTLVTDDDMPDEILEAAHAAEVKTLVVKA